MTEESYKRAARHRAQAEMEFRRPAEDVGRNRLVDAVSITLVLAAAAFLWWNAELGHSLLTLVCLPGAVFLAMYVAIAVHELGHLLAGRLVDLEWEVFKAGPFLLLRSGGSIRVSFQKDLRYQGKGLVVTAARGSDGARVRYTIMLLVGPAVSLFGGATGLALWSYDRLGPYVQLACGLFGACSLVVLLTSLLPVTSSGHSSDLSKVVRLLRGGKEGQSATQGERTYV